MRNKSTFLLASCALNIAVACGSGGSGHANSGSSSGQSGESGVGDDAGGKSSPSANGEGGTPGGDDSGDGGQTDGSGGDSGFLLGACASAGDCVASGTGAICCLNSSFRAVCQRPPCPLTSFGSRQLCDSSAECTSFLGQTYCGPIAGSTTSPLLVCGLPPPPEAGAVEDSAAADGGSDAAPVDAAARD